MTGGAGGLSIQEQARRDLPSRRMRIAHVMEWGGISWLAEVGFDRAGIVREVFAEAIEEISPTPTFPLSDDLRALAHDACIVLSHDLQRGDRIKAIAERLAPAPTKQARPTLICAIAARAALAELEDGGAIAMAYAAFDGRAL